MSFAGYLFLAAGLIMALVAGQKSRPREVAGLAFPALYIFHTGLSVYFWNIASSGVADARFYYISSGYPSSFGISNEFVIWIVYIVRSVLDKISPGTMLDYFILYSNIGFIGLIYLYNALTEILFDRNQRPRLFAAALLLVCIFSPGLNFWTSSIGKETVIFAGVAMSVYAVMDWRKRWPHLVVGLFLMVMARPYVLAFIVAAGAVQFLIAGRLSLVSRLAGLIVVGLIAWFGGPAVVEFTGLGSVDVQGVRDYVEIRQGYNLEGGSSVDISQMNFFFQVLTYLFRPLFFDADSMTAMAASVDNTLLLALVALALVNFRHYGAGLVREPAILLNLLFAGAGVAALAMTTANLGIAVRQKTMFLPSIFVVVAWGYVQARTVREARRARRRQMAAQRLAANPDLPGALLHEQKQP